MKLFRHPYIGNAAFCQDKAWSQTEASGDGPSVFVPIAWVSASDYQSALCLYSPGIKLFARRQADEHSVTDSNPAVRKDTVRKETSLDSRVSDSTIQTSYRRR